MNPFEWLISYLSPALDGVALTGLFQYTLLLIPTLYVVPLVVYMVIITGVRLFTKI